MNADWVVKFRGPRRLRGGCRAGSMAALLATALLAGCGQKGPLWVPGHAKNTPWPMKPAGSGGTVPVPAPAPATTPPAPAPADDKAQPSQGLP